MEDFLDGYEKITIGDILKRHRERKNLSLLQLAEKAGVQEEMLRKWEQGDTGGLGIGALSAIAKVLGIPTQNLVEPYIEREENIESLRELLQETFSLSSQALLAKVVHKLLHSPSADRGQIAAHLYKLAGTLADNDTRITLYTSIIHFARETEDRQLLAKSKLQLYMLQRLDLRRLEETYKDGEEIFHDLTYLTHEEAAAHYFRMSLHAFALRKYETSIEWCQAGLARETADTELRARAYLGMINSYYYFGDMDAVERHLDQFESFSHDFVPDAAMMTRASVKVQRRECDEAIPLLTKLLHRLGQEYKIHALNDLLEVYLHTGDLEKIAFYLQKEAELLPRHPKTPYKFLSLGIYYRQKAAYQTRIGLIDEGMESYVNSLRAYGAINAQEEIIACMNEIFSFLAKNSISMDLKYVVKLNEVYSNIRIIDGLKKKLHDLVKQKGFGDPSVVELSQQLDNYIVLAQRIK